MGVALVFDNGEQEFTSDFGKVARLVSDRDNLVVCHNIKFDYHALATVGIRIQNGACTLAMAHMADENRFDYSLDGLSREFLKDHKDDTAIKVFAKAFGWESIPWGLLEPYAKKDADLCRRLFHYFRPQVDFDLVQREFEFMRTVAEMEQRGVLTDPNFISEKITFGTQRMKEIENGLGFDPKKPSQLSKYLFDELHLPIMARTKTGKPSLDKKAMEHYDTLLEGLPILEYRGWQKIVSSYYSTLRDLGPTVHPDYQLQGTVTGRLSCKNPNLQQIPREGKKSWQVGTKQAFVGRPGFRLIEYDYSQLEFRLCAAYANEQALLLEFDDPNGDVFTAMADQLSMPRQQVKTLTYSVLYGAGVRRIAGVFGISEFEAGKLRDRFYATYRGIFQLSKATESAVIQRGYLKLWTGKRRHLESNFSYKAMNSLIQGGAAELVKEAMLLCDKFTDEDECRMLLQVHDAIVFEIKEELLEKYDAQIRAAMTESFPQFKVRLAVDGHDFRTGVKMNELTRI